MNKSRHVYTLFSLVLFLLFVIGLFFIVTYEIKGYQHIYESGLQQDELITPLAYLNTKLKAYDEKGAVSVEEVEGIQCLCLSTEQTKTYIYYHEGYLKEIYSAVDYRPSLSEGTRLFVIESFSITVKDKLYKFEIKKNGIIKYISIYLHA